MYTVSDAVEFGSAHKLILCTIKDEPFAVDDDCPYSFSLDEYFDE